jgi:hypothetical protein
MTPIGRIPVGAARTVPTSFWRYASVPVPGGFDHAYGPSNGARATSLEAAILRGGAGEGPTSIDTQRCHRPHGRHGRGRGVGAASGTSSHSQEKGPEML